MYIQTIFSETDNYVLGEFIKSVSFGALIVQDDGKIEVNHIPFEFVEDHKGLGLLRAHVSKKNPCCKLAMTNENVVVIFTGPNAYISPKWMPGNTTHRKVAPSWNYAAVHVYGKAKIINKPHWIINHLASLTASIESKRSDPWSLADADSTFVQQIPKHIVGIEVSISEMQGKFQASQQYSGRTQVSIQEGLANEGGDVGEAVRQMILERSK